ncbi:MAG: alpha/beta fold hydrolase [Gammaproteobacteria bacterium]
MHTTTLGLGGAQELVMVHGWGMHSGLLRQLADDLADDHHITLLDLPGHGHSHPYGALSGRPADAWVDAIAERLPERANVLGWSLGGILGIRLAARFPVRVRRLVLMAATPRFTRTSGWPHAVDPTVLEAFIHALAGQPRKTLMRFANLQLQGDEQSGAQLRILRRALMEGPGADDRALMDGLRMLATEDYRNELRALEQPVLALLGREDSLMPRGLADAMEALNDRIRCLELEGVAHLPFLSVPGRVAAEVRGFLAD